MCRITVIFETLKNESLLINIFALNNDSIYRNTFQNGDYALSKIDDAFLTKVENFLLFRLSDNGKILLACDVSIYNSNKKHPTGTSSFYTDFCVQALSCFHCCCYQYEFKILFVIPC